MFERERADFDRLLKSVGMPEDAFRALSEDRQGVVYGWLADLERYATDTVSWALSAPPIELRPYIVAGHWQYRWVIDITWPAAP